MSNRVNIFIKQAVFMACFVFAVFVTSASYAQTDLYNRLQRAERDIQTLSKAVYRGEALPEQMLGGIGDEQKYKAQLDVRLSDLETQIRTLRGQVEQYQYGLDSLTKRVDSLSTVQQSLNNVRPVINNPAPMLTDPSPRVVADKIVTNQNTSQNLTVSSDPAQDYELAFSLLKSGDNAAAQKAFTQFIQRYPDDKLTGNARYWLGESYYVQNAYDQAARTFAAAYQKSPQGSKAPDNLLKLGLSLSGLGRKDDACVSFSQLDKEFGATASAIVRRGEQESSSLGC